MCGRSCRARGLGSSWGRRLAGGSACGRRWPTGGFGLRPPYPFFHGLWDALIASLGFAVQYLALAQAGSGLWPVVAGRVAAALVVLPAARRAISVRTGAGAAGCGALAAVALACYLLATRQALDVVAVVLSSLYPAVPILLGITVLRERLSRWQVLGLASAGAAIGLLALG